MSVSSLTVASANLGNHRQVFPAIAQTRRLRVLVGLLQPHVVCIQEAKPGIKPAPGYRMIRFSGAGAIDNPIMIRKDLVNDLRGQQSVWVHHGKQGAWVPKWITAIDLRAWGAIANTHVIAKYDTDGRPTNQDSERWSLAFRYNHAVRSWALHRPKTRRIAAGDWNADLQDDQRVDYVGFPAQQMADAGMVDVPYRKGTLGRRTVDRIFYSDGRLDLEKWGILNRVEPFDHDHPWATFGPRP